METAGGEVRITLPAAGAKWGAAWLKDLSGNGGWGRTVAASDPGMEAGEGDRIVLSAIRLDGGGKAPVRRFERPRMKIYQLLVRTFGNTNPTRKPNGTLEENGCGTFADLHGPALDALREMGITHLWLTGVLQQATATSYADVGQPADDPDLLKGLAGSPYAIRDYFDVCPDYAVEPTNRIAEFKAAVERIKARGMGVLVDFVPNHVARSYASDVRPELDFGKGDNRTRFFARDNHFFYLTGPGGPPLRLPTFRDGKPTGPTVKALAAGDGLFDPETEFGRVTGNNAVTWTPGEGDWYETVKLNYGFDFTDPAKARREYPHGNRGNEPIPRTWRVMDEVLAYWQGLGVTGFRCDMAHMVPPEFWGWAIARARQRDPAVVFLAEAYDNDPAKVPSGDPVAAAFEGDGHVMVDLLNAGFDSVYDDPSYDALKQLYDGRAWANDLDRAAETPYVFAYALRYAENHDEVRVAGKGQWGGVGPEVGPTVCAVLFALGGGPVMMYAGQESGEPADGAEGFGGDDARTSIFDYWSMPEHAKWVNGGKYDGGGLSEWQNALRAKYAALLRAVDEPVLVHGRFFPLNKLNGDQPQFGRLRGETVSGHWLYAFLRHDAETGATALVVANLHPRSEMEDVAVRVPEWVAEGNLRERLGWVPEREVRVTKGELVRIGRLPPLGVGYWVLEQ